MAAGAFPPAAFLTFNTDTVQFQRGPLGGLGALLAGAVDDAVAAVADDQVGQALGQIVAQRPGAETPAPVAARRRRAGSCAPSLPRPSTSCSGAIAVSATEASASRIRSQAMSAPSRPR